MARPSWDEYFMTIAQEAARRATCPRAQVGCIITQDNRIVATGYNGSIEGQPHCDEAGHLEINGECVRGIHAEENAVNSAAKFGVALKGATAYVTHFPCWRCFRSLVSAGVSRIVFDQLKYSNHTKQTADEIWQVWAKSELEIEQLSKNPGWMRDLLSLIKTREVGEK